MPRFSQRNGYVASKAIQFETMDNALRTSLWNFIDRKFFESNEHYFYADLALKNRAEVIYDRFHKKAVRDLSREIHVFVQQESEWFNKEAKWYEVYDYCEFCLNDLIETHYNEQINGDINWVLEREKSGYRFVDGLIVPIIQQEQIDGIQRALDSPYEYRAAAEHIKTALILYADRQTPDYRNSIKESISSVESVAKIISGKDNATLADALRMIDTKKPVPRCSEWVARG